MTAATMKKPTVREMVEEITHGCDGPVTRFVIISRATELTVRLAANGFGRWATDEVSEALYMALVERGFMEPDADPYEDGARNTSDSDSDDTQEFWREAVF